MSSHCIKFAKNLCIPTISDINGKLVEICVRCGTRDVIYDPNWDASYKHQKIITERLERFGLPASLTNQVLLTADNDTSNPALLVAMSMVLAKHQIYVPYSKLMYVNRTNVRTCLLYTSPSPRDKRQSRMPSSA